MWLHPFFLSPLLGEDPMHKPCVTPCSATCPRLTLVLLVDQWWLPLWLHLLQGLEERLHTQLPAGRCFHVGAYLSHIIRASLWTMTDDSVSIGGLAFPQAVLHPRRQAEAASAATRVICLSAAALLKLWFGNRESQIDFRVFFSLPIPCDCH